ncbi:MAG: phosphatidylglycerophosphatase A [Pirellulales bacterium]|nr:phosphatidylglycerophosphatase A [Pirellulales bacterium]
MSVHDDNPLPATGLPGRLALWIATGLGIGLVAPAPGTIGGLWGLPLAAATSRLAPLGLQLGVVVALAVLAALVCTAAARSLAAGSDPQSIVLDEIVALPLAFIGVGPVTWQTLLLGFLLFRVCDILKPGLARSAEQLPRGWGIVADDCVAAMLACVLLHGAISLDAWAGWGALTRNG